jgi:heme oxygenase (biliverdin-producing, ferredoxin)
MSERLRSDTRGRHDRANSAAFVTALLAGELERGSYASLLEQSYLFYSALEEAGEHWRGDAVIGGFVSDALTRCAALEADLQFLHGPEWRSRLLALPATQRYIDRIRERCFSSRAAFVAHHYTRYLGDLSGGQIVRRRLLAIYGLTSDGVRFYDFDAIAKPKLFKDAYRELLDTVPWTPAEATELVEEANEAFELNIDVLEDLGRTSGLAA